MHYKEENFEKALAEEETFLEIAKRLKNKFAECEATSQMGVIYGTLHNMQKALNLFSDALKMAKEFGHRKKMIEIQLNQTAAYASIGSYKKAYHDRKQMVKMLSTYENKSIVFAVLCSLTIDALILNKDKKALKLAQESLVVAEQLDARQPIALAHGNIGLVQEKLRDYDGAIKSFERSLENGKKINDTRIIYNIYCSLGRVYGEKGGYMCFSILPELF
jgi:tetratricopeptide (TPR) repeat protein